MKLTFKQYNESLQYKQLSLEASVDWVLENCNISVIIDAIRSNKFICRGFRLGSIHKLGEYGTVIDTTHGNRFSANTSNWYTIILDNVSGREHFPKRSKSLICTNVRLTAEDYGYLCFIFPKTTTNVGIVHSPDIWYTQITLFGYTGSIDQLNGRWNTLFNHGFSGPDRDHLERASWQSFLDMAKKLKDGEKMEMESFKRAFYLTDDQADRYADRFLEEIAKAYSPKKTGHEAMSGSMFHPDMVSGTELWIQGEMLAVPADDGAIPAQFINLLREKYENR